MLRTFHARAAFTVAAAGAAIVLGAGSALAASGWTVVAAPPTGQNATLTGVATVGSFTPAGSINQQTLTLNWNGTAWSVVASPNTSSTDGVGSVATNPGAAIVWAVGESGPAGSFNPLILQNG